MTLIVDASVAAKWFFEEEGSARALKLREESDLIAPDFILLEVYHAMWKRLARRESEKIAVERVQRIACCIIALSAVRGARRSSRQHIGRTEPRDLRLFILGSAAETDGRLVTADQRQFSAARRMRLAADLL